MIEDRSERLELVATVLLGIATAASAWCAYEGQLWNSAQLRAFARASRFEAESLRATDESTRNAVLDATAFANVVQAEARGDHRLARYVAEVARVEFRPALQSWLAARGSSASGEKSPFADGSYRAEAQRSAAALRSQSDDALAAARVANQNGDLFVLHAVILALSLFFLGISGQLKYRAPRRLAVAFGAFVLVATLVSLTRLQRAERPHQDRTSAPSTG
jgi:hypothetical protein